MNPLDSRCDEPTMEVFLLLLDELDDAVAIVRHRVARVLPFLSRAVH